jgi:hypothetical protein
VPGDTPMERLIALTKRVTAVPKAEIDGAIQRYGRRRRAKRKSKSVAPRIGRQARG